MTNLLLDVISDVLIIVIILLLIVTTCYICSCANNCNRNDKLDRIEAALSQIATAEKGAAK